MLIELSSLAERMERKRKLLFHRRASASFPLGDGIEIAFQILQLSWHMWPPPSRRSVLPHSSYLDSNKTALSHHSLQLSPFTIERGSAPKRALAGPASEKQTGWSAVVGEGKRAAPSGRLEHCPPVGQPAPRSSVTSWGIWRGAAPRGA